MRMQENTDQKNTEYRHLLRSEWFIHNKRIGISMEMQSNPETNEQANKGFSRKPNTDDHIPIKLNDSPV